MYNEDYYLNHPYECPQCKKSFFVPISGSWVYRYQVGKYMKLFCSWGCLRKYEKSHPLNHKKTNHGIRRSDPDYSTQ